MRTLCAVVVPSTPAPASSPSGTEVLCARNRPSPSTFTGIYATARDGVCPRTVARTRALSLVALSIGVAACSNDAVPTALVPEDVVPQQLISDAVHLGKPHLYFLPPMVSAPVVGGVFDPALAPNVEICVLSGASCGSVLTTFVPGTTSTNVRLDATAQHYIVNWHTNNFDLDPAKTYRIRVLVGGV